MNGRLSRRLGGRRCRCHQEVPVPPGLLHDGRLVVLQDVALLGKTLRGFLNLLQVPDFE
jgi:hypothetical protein